MDPTAPTADRADAPPRRPPPRHVAVPEVCIAEACASRRRHLRRGVASNGGVEKPGGAPSITAEGVLKLGLPLSRAAVASLTLAGDRLEINGACT